MLGVKTVNSGSACRLAHVFDGSPARLAGLSAHDELVALDRLRVTRENLDALLTRHAAGDVVRHVSRMRARAEEQRTRLPTFAADTELAFASPAEFEQFTTALAAFVVREAASRRTADGGRKYRVLVAGYPAPGKPSGESHAGSRPRRSARRRTH